MTLLLDTHAFLWFIEGDAKLSQRARDLIEDRGNEKYVSAASLWEMAIKVGLGKLSLDRPFTELVPSQMELNGFILLPLRISHIARIISFPFHHRDPFDRIIAAQCMEESFSLVSVDPVFEKYSVKRMW